MVKKADMKDSGSCMISICPDRFYEKEKEKGQIGRRFHKHEKMEAYKNDSSDSEDHQSLALFHRLGRQLASLDSLIPHVMRVHDVAMFLFEVHKEPELRWSAARASCRVCRGNDAYGGGHDRCPVEHTGDLVGTRGNRGKRRS